MKVELFGVLREAVGAAEVDVDLAGPAPIAEVLDVLVSDYPGLAEHLPRVACAVGDDMRSRSDVIEPAETLVLLPPVSGG